MATRLYGVLLDGLKKPIVNATVVLLAKGNTITVLNGSEAIFKTDAQGAYNVTVQPGYYKVIIGPQGIEPYKAGEIAIYADSLEGSLNSYLVNWAEEDLTPEVIKQVKELVANSEQFALQAGRSAAAAQSDATDARNSKASAAQSASEALVYKNDSKTNADAAKQAQAGASGSANTASAALTTIQGIQKDVTASKDRAVTAETNAKSSENVATQAKTDAVTAKDQAVAAKDKAQQIADSIDPQSIKNSIGLGAERRYLTDLTKNFSDVGFYMINSNTVGYPSVADQSAMSGYITRQDGTPTYTGLFVDPGHGHAYTMTQFNNIATFRQLTFSADVDRIKQLSAGTRIYGGPADERYFEIHTGAWGVYNVTEKKWIPLAISQGGTGAVSVSDARVNFGLSVNDIPQFKGANLVNVSGNAQAASGILSGYLNDVSGEQRTRFRVYSEIRGDNKAWLTLHLQSDTATNKYAGLNIDGNFQINGNYIGNALSLTDVATSKVNLQIDRLAQWASETWLYNASRSMRLGMTESSWGVYSDTQKKWIPLDLSHGGTGATTLADAKTNLEIPYSGFNDMVLFDAPDGAVDGKYYPVIIKMPTNDLRYLGSEIAIQTRSALASDPMNCCTFTGYIRSAGSSDRKQCVYGMFSQYDGAEKAIHSVLMASTSDEQGYTAFYIEKRAFPIKVRVAQRCEVVIPTADFSFSDVTFKWGASNPASESTNASEILRFTASGFHSSNAMYTKSRCIVETSDAGYVIRGTSGDTTQALYYMAQDANQRRLFYIGKSGNNQDVVINNDMKSSSVTISDNITLRTPSYNGGIFADATAIAIRSANNRLFRFENTKNAAKDAIINLWGNTTGRPSVVECKLTDGYLWYAQQNTDGSRVFQVNGAVNCVSVNQSSDRDLKDNIKEIPNATESIRKMSGYTYTLKENGLPYAGVIAQEVMEALPEAVSGFTRYTDLMGATEDGQPLVGEERFYTVDYGAVTGLLVKVCREADDRISKLETEVEELKKLVATLVNKEPEQPLP